MQLRGAIGLIALLSVSCASPAVEPHAATEVSLWLSPTYDGAVVCVETTCDVIDGDDTFLVEPGIVGATFDMHVSMDGVELLLEPTVATDLEFLRLDPESARIDAVSLLLLRRSESDSSCLAGVDTLETEGWVAFGEYPPSLSERRCGPFATD